MSAIQNAVIPVKSILIHANPHMDEILSYLLVRLYGEERFPGIGKAYVRYAEGDVHGVDAEYDKDGILPFGCGFARFDEHTEEGERADGKCATTLVAEYLGVGEKPELTELIKETLTCDSQGRCTSTQLAELIKVANRQHKQNNDNLVLNWAIRGLEALVMQEKYHIAPVLGEKTLLEIFRSLIDKGSYGNNEKVRQYLFSQVHASMARKDESLTEFSHVTEALFRRGYPEDEVTKWVDFGICNLVGDQVEFQEQLELFRQQELQILKVELKGRIEDLRLAVCVSDSLQAHKAARYLGAHIILMRQSSGNVQVFADSRIPGLSLVNVARMVRWLDLPISKKNIDWKDLGCEGKHPEPEIGHWYYLSRGEMLFNGSTTHKAPPTAISTQALVDVLIHAFCYSGIRAWCNKREIRMNGKPASKSPVDDITLGQVLDKAIPTA